MVGSDLFLTPVLNGNELKFANDKTFRLAHTIRPGSLVRQAIHWEGEAKISATENSQHCEQDAGSRGNDVLQPSIRPLYICAW